MDGTRIKAVNNKDRNFTQNSLQKFGHIAEASQQAGTIDRRMLLSFAPL